jgi:hypothetical protein
MLRERVDVVVRRKTALRMEDVITVDGMARFFLALREYLLFRYASFKHIAHPSQFNVRGVQ